MISRFFIRLLQLLGLLVLQVLVFSHVHIMGYATPLVYVVLLAYFPLNASRISKLFWAFAMGFTVDVFSSTPGIASGAMTLAAMVQHPLLQMLQPKDATEDMVPTYRSMGKVNHLRYLAILVAVHHVAYFLLASFSFNSAEELLIFAGGSYGLTMAIILVMETLRGRKKTS